MKKEIRIPTLFGLFLLVVGLVGIVTVVERGQSFFLNAAGDSVPKDVTITNLSDSQVSITWITHSPSRGLVYFKEKLGTSRTGFDTRDVNGIPQARYTHFVMLTGLRPQTAYEITITSNNKTYDSAKVRVTTSIALTPPTQAVNPSFGTLLGNDDTPMRDALVYTSFPGSQTLGNVVDPDGSWIIPLGTIRTTDGGRYFLPTKQDHEQLTFVGPNGRITIPTTIEEDSPLPPVRLINNRSSKLYPVIAQAQTNAKLETSVNDKFQVLSPKDKSAIPADKPAVKGTGTPGKRVIITLTNGTTPTAGNVLVSSGGSWNWTPTTLSPGIYQATAVSFTPQDEPVTVAFSFTILKSGSSVLQAATPSATITPSPKASPKISPLPSTISSASATPTSASPSTTPPVTGTVDETWKLFFLGVFILAAGLMGFVKTTTKFNV
ncbi:MAG: hypothetical protein AAB874_05730 [Patescibacteria group bacterium]